MLGRRSRVVFGKGDEAVGHAYAELFLTRSGADVERIVNEFMSEFSKLEPDAARCTVFVRRDVSGYWLNLDWFSDYPSGKYYPSKKEAVIYSDGGGALLEEDALPKKHKIEVAVASPTVEKPSTRAQAKNEAVVEQKKYFRSKPRSRRSRVGFNCNH